VWAVFKRSVVGSWHHVSRKHIPHYSGEAAMCLDDRYIWIETIDWMKSIARRMGGRREKYADLIADNRANANTTPAEICDIDNCIPFWTPNRYAGDR